MKVYIIITVKLLVTALLVYYLTNTTSQLMKHDSTTICMQT